MQALPKNLIELLAFVPPCKDVRQDRDGNWLCILEAEASPELVESLKMRFGFRTGVVTPRSVTIHKSYLSK